MPIRAELYPVEWPAISRWIRIDRARGRCECTGQCGTRGCARACALAAGDDRCAALNGAPNPRTGSRVVLTVAHLNDTPADCRDENLIAMCQACHLAYDHRHHELNAARTRRARRVAAGQLDLMGER